MRAIVCLALMMSGGVLVAQTGVVSAEPSAAVGDLQRSYAGLKGNVLKAADKMPVESFSFKPTPEVRTFARVVNHVSEAQLRACGALNGTAADALAKVPAETADKAAIVAALQASFAECDKAFAGLKESTFFETITMGPMMRARVSVAWMVVSHDNEQYATLALYLRLKGLVPPSSEK